ncbi:MAG: hypothetical protein ABL966_06575, partial [Acidimicrobiales bacterium]
MTTESRWTTGAARIGGAALGAHAGALLLVLLAIVPFVGLGVSYSADEGAAIIQAQSLAAGDGWIIPHPFPELDPRGDLYPLELSSTGPDGVAAYAKHPIYPVVLAAADRVGGQPAMILLSVLGTWLAALGAAVLTRQLTGGLARTALWVTGVGSPLLFDGYWVIAHSLGAAAIVWAVVAVVAALRSDGRRATIGVLVGAPLLVGLAGLLRTEAILYGGVLAIGALAAGLLARRASVMAGAIAIGGMSVVARLGDAAVERRIVGGAVGSTGSFDARSRGGGVDERIAGLVATWLRAATP